jgi:hypothetical protein
VPLPWVADLGVEIVQIICYILLMTVEQPVAKYILVTIATAASQLFFAIIWPEHIRAARDTTTAGLAFGIMNAGDGYCWAADLSIVVRSDVSCDLCLLHCSHLLVFGSGRDDLIFREEGYETRAVDGIQARQSGELGLKGTDQLTLGEA